MNVVVIIVDLCTQTISKLTERLSLFGLFALLSELWSTGQRTM